MAKDDVIEVEGKVVDTMPNAMFTVELENGHQILATVNIAFGIVSTTLPSTSITSSFATQKHPLNFDSFL